jgi:hypothetical protein
MKLFLKSELVQDSYILQFGLFYIKFIPKIHNNLMY